MDNYVLSIIFKSNIKPFSTKHGDRGRCKDDEQAKRWAAGMQEGLFDYYVTLFDVNGRHIPYEDNNDEG